MNYIEFLRSLGSFVDKGGDDYFAIALIVILSICILSILLSLYNDFKEIKNVGNIDKLFSIWPSIWYSLAIVIAGCAIYSLANAPDRLPQNLKR